MWNNFHMKKVKIIHEKEIIMDIDPLLAKGSST